MSLIRVRYRLFEESDMAILISVSTCNSTRERNGYNRCNCMRYYQSRIIYLIYGLRYEYHHIHPIIYNL